MIENNQQYKNLYTKIGKEIGINPLLLQAIALTLSNERQDAFVCDREVCKYGLMLLSMPGAKQAGFRGYPEDLADPETNITYAARYLRYLLQQYEYDLKKALVAYLRGRYDSRYVHDAEKILWKWRELRSTKSELRSTN